MFYRQYAVYPSRARRPQIPGATRNLKIVLIPDINSPEVRNILRPKVGIGVLARIQKYLKGIASPSPK